MPEFYGSVALADAYHEARLNTAWTGVASSPADAKEAALLRASVWLDGTYGARFTGTRTDGRDQSRAWPRSGATDGEGLAIASDEVPDEVLQATYEAAMRELTTPGSMSPDYTPAQGVKSETVGPISVTYRDGSGSQLPVSTTIDNILAPLLVSRGGSLYGFNVRA